MIYRSKFYYFIAFAILIIGLISNIQFVYAQTIIDANTIIPANTIIVAQGSSSLGCETTSSCYLPASLLVYQGETVTWQNHDTIAHTITNDDLSEDLDDIGMLFDSGVFNSGENFSATFDYPGDYPYFCMIHPWMTGIVFVDATASFDSIPLDLFYNETLYVYVDEMPKQWEPEFGNILSNATQWWEERLPGIKFQQVQSIDDSDFVVQWASQYLDKTLGYYTPDTNNYYGKSYITITLGYFDDESIPSTKRKFNLQDPELVLEITKHELGHALALSIVMIHTT
jgi:plastocyanin